MVPWFALTNGVLVRFLSLLKIPEATSSMTNKSVRLKIPEGESPRAWLQHQLGVSHTVAGASMASQSKLAHACLSVSLYSPYTCHQVDPILTTGAPASLPKVLPPIQHRSLGIYLPHMNFSGTQNGYGRIDIKYPSSSVLSI